MTKSLLLYDLAEMPKGMELDDVIKQYKEKNIILTDTNGINPINSKVITVEVTEDEIEKEVKKRVLAKIKQFRDTITEQLNKRGSVFTTEFYIIMDLAEKELTNKKINYEQNN